MNNGYSMKLCNKSWRALGLMLPSFMLMTLQKIKVLETKI